MDGNYSNVADVDPLTFSLLIIYVYIIYKGREELLLSIEMKSGSRYLNYNYI